MSLKACALGDDNRGLEAIVVRVLVGDIFDEQHKQDVVLVLACIHAAAQLIARSPDRGIEIGFFDCHEKKSLNGNLQ
jgi:hypothetical protein